MDAEYTKFCPAYAIFVNDTDANVKPQYSNLLATITLAYTASADSIIPFPTTAPEARSVILDGWRNILKAQLAKLGGDPTLHLLR